jgi:pimeloyl-ACP methyl ester carboxylesterase
VVGTQKLDLVNRNEDRGLYSSRINGEKMPITRVNGVRLFCELSGTGGIPLVLVHGSWVSHRDWDLVVPAFSRSFRVLTYDRRGHSESERPARQDDLRADVADLAALIEHLDLAPACVVGNSLGGSIALRLAGERPDLFRGLIAHEPPIFKLLLSDPAMAPLIPEVERRFSAVGERIASGNHAGAAQLFVESLALGPGSWPQVPPKLQSIMIENAPTFLDELNDSEQTAFDIEWIRTFPRPTLLTTGDKSPPTFAPVIERLAAELTHVEVLTFPGAGHIPHITHPEFFVDAVTAFIRKHQL